MCKTHKFDVELNLLTNFWPLNAKRIVGRKNTQWLVYVIDMHLMLFLCALKL